MAWTTPKTDWVETDSINISDFNRIKNNISYICNGVNNYIATIDIAEMGDDLTSYAGYWNVDYFNAFENNLETANENMLKQDIGTKMTFYVNGAFIKASELNRLEQATAILKKTLDDWTVTLDTVPFRLGNKGGWA